MATTEERLATLEARVDEHARGLKDLRTTVAHLEQRMDRRFEGIETRLTAMDGRLAGLDDKVSRYFVWMLGAQVSTLAAIVTILARG